MQLLASSDLLLDGLYVRSITHGDGFARDGFLCPNQVARGVILGDERGTIRKREIPEIRSACGSCYQEGVSSTEAREKGFLERFPMWDWVGGRTSETSTVGLLPAALQGIDVRALLDGAAAMDEATRRHETRANPAALLALAWHVAGDGRGTKAMVVLPYKDRLLLFSRYLQQLVMESLGKEKDLAGNVVHQGIAVYGNKGSTDQHAYVQQLRGASLAQNFRGEVAILQLERRGVLAEILVGLRASGFQQSNFQPSLGQTFARPASGSA